MSRFIVVASLMASALMFSRPLAAQAAGVQTVPFPIFGIGGGIAIPAGGVAKDRVPGFNLVGMAEFRTPSEPLGIRTELLYEYFGHKQDATTATNSTTIAGLINVVYHAPKSQVRPYVIAGMGLYHITDHGNNAGLNVGTGVTIPLTSMGAYAEVRLHAALSQGPSYVTIPLTFGLTF
jgi:hypothetical protein